MKSYLLKEILYSKKDLKRQQEIERRMAAANFFASLAMKIQYPISKKITMMASDCKTGETKFL
jgi:hypothetical protein